MLTCRFHSVDPEISIREQRIIGGGAFRSTPLTRASYSIKIMRDVFVVL